MKKIKKEIHFETVKKIVDFYECPAECQAYCCKNNPIAFTVNEYNNVGRSEKEISEIIKEDSYKLKCSILDIDFEGYELKTIPCKLLDNDRCRIHEKKFFICDMYPFKFYEGTPKNTISLDPCDMGRDIIKDYFAFLSIYIKTNIEQIGEKQAEYMTMDSSINVYLILRDSKDWKDHPQKLRLLHIPFDLLELFYKYLEYEGKEEMKEIREETDKFFEDAGPVIERGLEKGGIILEQK